MRSFFLAVLNGFIRNKPSIAATTQITASSMRPGRDVTLVLIRNSDSKPVQFDTSGFGEMKNVFVTIVQEALRANRLEMTVSSYCGFDPHLALRVRLSLARERIEVRVRRAGFRL